jgi:ABC-type dipeptide/oligopeptide/nickel transport system ATPase component/ABC-type amino acid transport system permease subunit
VDAVRVDEKPSNLWLDAWRDLRRRPDVLDQLVVVAIVLLMAIWPTLFTQVAPNSNCQLSNSNGGPTDGHPLGFTFLGCDIYARMVWGARTSLTVGLLATIIGTVIGLIMGAFAGFYGGWLDSLLSRVGDIFFSIPYILAAIVVMSVFGQPQRVHAGVRDRWFRVGIHGPRRARRSAAGASGRLRHGLAGARQVALRTLISHVVPNAIAPLLVVTTISLAAAIVAGRRSRSSVSASAATSCRGATTSARRSSRCGGADGAHLPVDHPDGHGAGLHPSGRAHPRRPRPESEGPPMSATSREPLLSVRDLRVAFESQSGSRAVLHGVNFDIFPGETIAIVASRSGKSTTASAIVQLLPGTGHVTRAASCSARRISPGQPGADGEHPRPRDRLRPAGSDVEPQPGVVDRLPGQGGVRANGIASGKKEIEARAIEVLKQAGLADADKRMHQYPHQFSGGMRQRALIGIGLAADPKLLIADEPTSALDVTVQRVILDHMASSRGEGHLGAPDHARPGPRGRARRADHRHEGRRDRRGGPSRLILENPQHPYTQRLVAAAPRSRRSASRRSWRIAASRRPPTSPTRRRRCACAS